MSLKNDDYPSSVAFDTIASALQDESVRKDAIKKGKGIFAFKLKNAAGSEETWHIDVQESGTVGMGQAPQGKKATAVLALSDENFGKLVAGKANAQSLYISGKLKISGNMMAATRLQPILEKAGGKSKL